jgi:hypothetical protein
LGQVQDVKRYKGLQREQARFKSREVVAGIAGSPEYGQCGGGLGITISEGKSVSAATRTVQTWLSFPLQWTIMDHSIEADPWLLTHMNQALRLGITARIVE